MKELLLTVFVGLQGGDGPVVLLYLSLDSLNFVVGNKLWTLKKAIYLFNKSVSIFFDPFLISISSSVTNFGP
jgi:hypothetical protein